MSGPRVALVYPPFGSAALPSLALALLAAHLRRAGIDCRCFYWNLDILDRLPYDSPSERFEAYRTLTEGTWYPFNEWIFGREVHGAALDEHDLRTEVQLLERAAALADEPLSADVVLDLRASAHELVENMADRLVGFDVVGISTTFFQNLPALALAKQLKATSPRTTVVLGGANCDGEMGPTLLELFPFLDAVFVGEADRAFVPYVEMLSRPERPTGVPGLHWRDRAGVIHSEAPAAPIEDMESLPFPDYSDWLTERRRVGLDGVTPLVLALESSRGCWWGQRRHCTFCGLNANGMRYRSKGPERFVAEVTDVVARYDPKFIFMTDNILSRDYFDTFMEWARAADLKIDFFYEVKANTSRDEVRRLAEAGVTSVQPGIESFSSEALRLMRKGATAIQNVAFVKNAEEYGVRAAYNLLIGFPKEDPEWYRPVVAQMPRLAHLRPPTTVATVEFHRFSPYHNDPQEFGLTLRPSEAYESLYPFGTGELSRIAYEFRQERHEQGAPDPPHWSSVRRAVLEWRHAYDRLGAQLIMRRDGTELVIDDARPAFGPRRVRLYGFAATLYELLQDPQPIRTLLAAAESAPSDGDFSATVLVEGLFMRPDEVAIGFDAEEFRADAPGSLDLLDEAGLVFVERREGQPVAWLALALPAQHAPTPTRWVTTGV